MKQTPADPKTTDEIDLAKIGITEDVKKVSRKTIVEGIIRPRLNEIFTMVNHVIKQSGLEGQTPAGVIVTGGGALTSQLYRKLPARHATSSQVRYPHRSSWTNR